MFLLCKNMKIVINNELNNARFLGQRKYAQNTLISKDGVSTCQSSDIKQIENPFVNHLSFTGGINKLNIVKTNSLESLIQDLIDFKGDNIEFAKHSFNKLKKHFGYGDLITDNLEIVNKEESSGLALSKVAEFNYPTGKFWMNKEDCLSLSRCEIASVLRHEFEHFFQFERMFSSEEIGIEKYLKEESRRVFKKTNNEAYIFGIEEVPQVIQNPTNSFSMNMKFWSKIIDKKGILKIGTVEAKQAKNEFEALVEYESYIDVTRYKEYSGLPRLQETIYYDKHGIGETDDYWNNPLEIGARREEKNFLDKYLKLSKEPYVPNNEIVEVEKTSNGIDELMRAYKEKFKTNHLPDRFKAYVYDEIVSKLLKENLGALKEMHDLDCIKDACKTIKGLSSEEVKTHLLNFKKLIEKGDIRLYSKEETNDFMKLANEFSDK